MALRKLTAKSVLAKLLPKRQALGISRIADLSDFVKLNVRVVQAVRTTLVKGQVSATSGKGWHINEAVCGALGEALERYCAAHIAPERLITRFDIPSDAVARIDNFGYPKNVLPRDFIAAHDLLSGRLQHIPALEVCFPHYGPDVMQTGIRPHTSGLASGADLTEASLFGIFEVVERHASSLFFRHFKELNRGAVVNTVSIRAPAVKAALNDLDAHGYESLVFRVNTILPTYYVALLDTANLGPKFMVAGISSHAFESNALEGALLEAMQGLIVGMQGAREDLVRHEKGYRSQRVGKQNPFYLIRQIISDANPTIDFDCSEKSGLKEIDAQTILDTILQKLNGVGINAVYQCDLSQPTLPLSVVKIIIPRMFDDRVNPSRGSNVIATS